ncbi:glycoside hydrolase family 43 protein [Pinibacter aurantiacus]|uniref:Glycoside hydrolase family 43 protein n=1 Tax=Pinibacter aurantiacus TaxID=2851599 RepID=A0A9E2S9L4_9BACT|nr:glycoside hydrolase family 43 protein [Pinibacter aurantiacus]MBV4359018.1 glycoside hydrolase family 43 protein [Pinibacter aurantiacus]
MMKLRVISILLIVFTSYTVPAQNKFLPGEVWKDTNGEVINAHGGTVIYAANKYYLFGETRGRHGTRGVSVYSSNDLYQWKPEGLALETSADTTSDITRGCVMERPKVVYNKKTKKYILWFHLELKGKGYAAARAAVAMSDKPAGPYTYIGSFRPNGNMSRDMTIFKDKDDKAYLIYSSNENYDLRVAQLTDDYLSVTTQDKMLFSNHREAPAVFRKNNTYYLITSGCTGWAPNKATLHTASSIWGPWELAANNPMQGENADLTFGGQSTYILPVENSKDKFIFLADIWKPADLADSRYIWLPIQFKDNVPYIQWMNEWDLNFFK